MRLLALLLLTTNLATAKPNVVLFLCDNLGNGDIACFNPTTKHRTPNLDKLAANGRKFTSFYSASGVCTPSRAALMTGCYPRRVGLHISGDNQAVLKPVDKKGLNPAEETLAELMKAAGYATGCFGKWHLGDQPEFLPTSQGFDTFLGIPYSEDMIRGKVTGTDWPELPLLKDATVIEAPTDATFLTHRVTEAAVSFIEQNKSRPFFLYIPEPGPGSRKDCYPHPDFKGKSANSAYGDAIEELDWSAGQVIAALDQHQLTDNTLVIWTNDNGAVNRNPPQGSNAPYRGMGYSTSEGAVRMPCIISWPGKIPTGTVCDELTTMMDLLPTITALAEAPQPAQSIDGHNIIDLITGRPNATSPYEATGFYYYQIKQLQAIRCGPWKLYLPLNNKQGLAGAKGNPSSQPLQLFNVQTDLHEDHEVSAQHQDIVNQLLAKAEAARQLIGDNNHQGTGQRPPGWNNSPKALIRSP